MEIRGELRTSVAVAIGSVIGASARWAVGTQLAPDAVDRFPWHTFAVNMIGCALIGLAATRIRRPSLRWDLVATGGLGGFTTMSAFAVELNDLVDAGAGEVAVAYLVASILVGFVVLAAAEALAGSVDDAAEGPASIE